MALSENLYVYLTLERIMMDLDDRKNPLADSLRDLMDPLWDALTQDDRMFLDGRGLVEVQALYPVTLVVPNLFREQTQEEILYQAVVSNAGVGKHFRLKDDVICAA